MSSIAMICFIEGMRDNAIKNYWNGMRSVKWDDVEICGVPFCFGKLIGQH
jgi:hypothetical protein